MMNLQPALRTRKKKRRRTRKKKKPKKRILLATLLNRLHVPALVPLLLAHRHLPGLILATPVRKRAKPPPPLLRSLARLSSPSAPPREELALVLPPMEDMLPVEPVALLEGCPVPLKVVVLVSRVKVSLRRGLQVPRSEKAVRPREVLQPPEGPVLLPEGHQRGTYLLLLLLVDRLRERKTLQSQHRLRLQSASRHLPFLLHPPMHLPDRKSTKRLVPLPQRRHRRIFLPSLV